MADARSVSQPEISQKVPTQKSHARAMVSAATIGIGVTGAILLAELLVIGLLEAWHPVLLSGWFR